MKGRKFFNFWAILDQNRSNRARFKEFQFLREVLLVKNRNRMSEKKRAD